MTHLIASLVSGIVALIAPYRENFLVPADGNGTVQEASYVAARTINNDSVQFELQGGSFQSYGCKPIEPAYWITGNRCTVTIRFRTAETNPSFRVWGMNTDDVASVHINGAPYPLTNNSASYSRKIVCGTSPGPDGVVFANGNLMGANTASDGNYSYQDVQVHASNVSEIVITGLSGAGWGFAGVSIHRDAPKEMNSGIMYQEQSKSGQEQASPKKRD